MSIEEAAKHFGTLTRKESKRFNNLILIALRLGKPHEGAYDYAKTIMDKEKI